MAVGGGWEALVAVGGGWEALVAEIRWWRRYAGGGELISGTLESDATATVGGRLGRSGLS